ncbi:MAG: hypothetical protein Q7K42_06555, partial [Candidatus Diapherotrites archaeon]|nr:hypothetical protein [Candidatus Diapherotrites archaeon]
PKEVKALLINSSEDLGIKSWDKDFGWGYMDLNKAFYQKNFVDTNKISAGKEKFFKADVVSGDKFTLVWNRHFVYTPSTAPNAYYKLNDLDLYLYNASTGEVVSSSASRLDSVEQVESNFSGPAVLKVVSFDKNFSSSISQEEFAIASSKQHSTVSGIDFNFSLTSSLVSKNTFKIQADILNKGDIIAPNIFVSLSFPSGFALVSGADANALIASFSPGETKTVEWIVSGDNTLLNQVIVSYSATPFGLNFYERKRVDRILPQSDAKKPSVAIETISKQFLSGVNKITINASDKESWIETIGVYVDGNFLTTLDIDDLNLSTYLYQFDLNTTKFSDKNHTLRTVAFDALNNSQENSVIFTSDNTPPVSSITNRDNNKNYEKPVDLSITAIDNLSGVNKTYYSVNGYPFKESSKFYT